MNEVALRNAGPSWSLASAFNSEFANKAATVANSIRNTAREWDAWHQSVRKEAQARRHGRSTIAVAGNPRHYENHLQAEIERGDTTLAHPNYQTLVTELEPYIGTATVTQIKIEIAKLLAAFPTKDNLTVFTAILIEEIAENPPSRLALAMACRELRRNSKFRPSISEVLEALDELDWHARRCAMIVRLPKYVAALKQRLAQGLGCYVTHERDGHSVVDSGKLLAGPFVTMDAAWSWLERHGIELVERPSITANNEKED